ncbi:hypothetical protein MKZ38_003613 [Zalerion maritima]|uniref:LysM domain-containing protein n=1 Tax=Zalerion maritima TaxID=339359 RepID=A0AAD5RMI9_9PEZI|nr:hypothetical protein MKZ38_003613 [Zalerion maritima]
MSAPGDPDPLRPRNRRQASKTVGTSSSTSTSLLDLSPAQSERTSRAPSPLPPSTRGSSTARHPRTLFASSGRESPVNTAITKASGLLDVSWSNFTGFASSLLGDQGSAKGSGNGKSTRTPGKSKQPAWTSSTPGSSSRPGPDRGSVTDQPCAKDIAAGALAQREAKLRARKTASVLESHVGVNGGLDVAGRFKRRTSDENLRSLASPKPTPGLEQLHDEDCLVYIHHILLTDTYSGIVLRYRCRDDAIKKANGIWNPAHIHIRRHVLIPVDACEIKGRPCEPPNYANAGHVDLLAPTPNESTEASSLEGPAEARGQPATANDYFGINRTNRTEVAGKLEHKPWEHVRWVKIDGFMSPVEIGRVPRKTLGYYPPRRKKSNVSSSFSATSTPRQSIDIQSSCLASPSRPSLDQITSPGSTAPRRRGDSLMSNSRYSVSGHPGRSRSRMGSTSTTDDPRPAWMRGPGGIGTLGRNVRAPGPQTDALNKWARKHFASIAVDDLPSMSVVGSETAHFGFAKEGEAAEIAQGGDGTPHAEGGPANESGLNLDKMAIGIESWLRGAWQNRSTGTPIMGPRRRAESDLIELEDTSDDGRLGASLLSQDPLLGLPETGTGSGGGGGSSGWSAGGGGAMRGRTQGKDRKSD